MLSGIKFGSLLKVVQKLASRSKVRHLLECPGENLMANLHPDLPPGLSHKEGGGPPAAREIPIIFFLDQLLKNWLKSKQA